MSGIHTYRITNSGLNFFPRLEAQLERTLHFEGVELEDTRFRFGLPELERMMGGGLPRNSSTVVSGSTGTGKTLLGLHYLNEGLQQGDGCLFIGFSESIEQLMVKARNCNLSLQSGFDSGQLQFLTINPVEMEVDWMMEHIKQKLAAFPDVKRVVFDGLNEIDIASRIQGRNYGFIMSMMNFFKMRGITMLYTYEVSKLVGTEFDLSNTSFTAVAENMILLKQVEYDSQLYRIMAILKMRDTGYDSSIRQYKIESGGGITIQNTLQSVEGLLSGIARKLDRPGT